MVIPDIPDAFSMAEAFEPGGLRLRICGELDVAVIGRLRDRLDSLANAPEAVVVDLSELTFVDSSGLNVLVTAFKQAKQDGRDLRIDPNMRPPVQRVVKMMGLDALFWSNARDPQPGS